MGRTAFRFTLAWLSLAAAVLAAAPATALQYSLMQLDRADCRPDCPEAVVATGEISKDEITNLEWFLNNASQNRRLVKLMLIHSSGGNMYGGLTLGAYLRHNGVSVVVAQSGGGGMRPGVCGSACVLVLAGGKKRFVPNGSAVVVHASAPIQTETHDIVTGVVTQNPDDRQGAARTLARYYQLMGVRSELAVLSEQIPHSQFRVLTPAEVLRYRLAATKF